MRWGKAFTYGLKYLAFSALFNIVGAIMILSSLSISVNLGSEGLVISINALKTLANIGSLMLLAMGFAILVLGNIASFVKVLVEAVKEINKELLW